MLHIPKTKKRVEQFFLNWIASVVFLFAARHYDNVKSLSPITPQTLSFSSFYLRFRFLVFFLCVCVLATSYALCISTYTFVNAYR